MVRERVIGFYGLSFHDAGEEFGQPPTVVTRVIPQDADYQCEVVELIKASTFLDFPAELKAGVHHTSFQAYKTLIDKTSNLNDATWMTDDKHDTYKGFISQVLTRVKEPHASTTIVRFAQTLCAHWNRTHNTKRCRYPLPTVDQISTLVTHLANSFDEEPAWLREMRRDSVPYLVYPVWAAMTILTEMALPKRLRVLGFYTLMFQHLIGTDGSIEPIAVPQIGNWGVTMVNMFGKKMAFVSLEEEVDVAPTLPRTVQLFLLYEKISYLMGTLKMSRGDAKRYLNLVRALTNNVEERFGTLNIVLFSRVLQSHNSIVCE